MTRMAETENAVENASLVSAKTHRLEILVLAGYSVLGAVLIWSRFADLGQSYWHDEIVTVAHFVRAGPREILFGTYLSNNHELFSLLAWATSWAIGYSEIVSRLWSVIPFISGVPLVTGWLHARMGAPTALLYLFFAMLSPQLRRWSSLCSQRSWESTARRSRRVSGSSPSSPRW